MRRMTTAGKFWIIWVLFLLAGIATIAFTYDAHGAWL
jgi:hypothetical protein